MAPTHRTQRLRVLSFTGVLFVAAAAVTLFVVRMVPHGDHGSWHLVALVVGAFFAAEKFAAHLTIGRSALTCSFSEIPLVVGLAFLHPVALVAAKLIGAGPMIATRLGRSTKLPFNLALIWLETVLAVVVWHAVLGGHSPYGPRGWLAALAVLVATDVLASAAIGVVMRLTETHSSRQNLHEFVAGSLAALANVSVAVLVIALIAVDWRTIWALFVLIALLAAAYRSYSQLRRRHDGLERLAGYTAEITGDLRTQAVAEAVVARAGAIVEAEVVELDWWSGGPGAVVHVVARRGRALDERVLARLFEEPTREPLLAPCHVRDPQLCDALGSAGLRDVVIAPLVIAGAVRGTLLVGDRQGDVATFNAEDANFVQAVANQAAAALASAELADRLRDEAEQRHHEALHDALTGLPNRVMFREAVAQQVSCGGRAAVMLLDLNRFKEINDTLGHHLGDELLKKVAARLVETLPEGTVVARLGGDEFTVLLPDVEEGEAVQAAARLRTGLLRPIRTRDLTLHTDCSVGIALTPQHGQDVDVLLQRADVAMYSAKEDHSGFAVYSTERDQYHPRRLAMVADLRDAISNDGLQVHYQPKVDLATSKLVGVEALVRWSHPEYGFVPPDEFLPIAEQTDLMLPLTLFVLERALSDLTVWDRDGLETCMAVNLSPRVLLEPALTEHVSSLLRQFHLRPGRLTLEITEGSVIGDPARAINVLEQLDAMGVRLSVDDFGTGYSSLSYLRRLPVHEIKIDKSFIMELKPDSTDAAIVQSTIDLAHRLGMQVVAEGLETPAAGVLLSDMACDIAQGYLLSRPVPAATLADWARQWPQQAAAVLERATVAAIPVQHTAAHPRLTVLRTLAT